MKNLVLIPGLLCDRRLYALQMAALENDFDFLVADVSQDASVGEMAKRLLADAPEKFHLAGLSMGGYVALEVMRRAPERVEKLALLDTSARPDSAEQKETRTELVEAAKSGKFQEVAEGMPEKLLHGSRMQDEKLVSLVVQMGVDTGTEAFARQQTAIMARPDSRPDLPNITCPTLVLCGGDDALTPPEVHEELAGGIPNTTLRVLEKCGHLSTLERPQEVNEALGGFLRG
ncbi:alpha/beta fold hydrolase [Rubrobacter indicoceani]|uniref:alpha/beta fold hydrolase n=1 Tax=Rubrobacter indicoceani TaxID=2051957 RepID=UPI000E5C15B5|nr:alpha/beta fold hydrolase [Rubrobacter indicoceani]